MTSASGISFQRRVERMRLVAFDSQERDCSCREKRYISQKREKSVSDFFGSFREIFRGNEFSL